LYGKMQVIIIVFYYDLKPCNCAPNGSRPAESRTQRGWREDEKDNYKKIFKG